MTYHYILTVQYSNGHGGMRVSTLSGPWYVSEGDTRSDVYDEIIRQTKGALAQSHLNTMFFSLEKDEL
jgi:hypothetical protein